LGCGSSSKSGSKGVQGVCQPQSLQATTTPQRRTPLSPCRRACQ
jgi:hypothetical protein